ncbi:hypothetical protein [Caulobacter sp.]|uniref:hypothetical protein n=1 Tax=Caulobacter sp. TaxID=78 RepID=UPI003BB01A4F
MALKLTLTASIVGALTGDNDLVTVSAPIDIKKVVNLTTGSGLNQAGDAFADRRTLAAGASEGLDLSGGLFDVFGVALNFTKIKAIEIIAAAANTNDVVLGGAAANAFVGPFGAADDTCTVPPGGVVMLVNPTAAGWPVTPGTGDLLKVANSAGGTAVTYDIVIVGA